MFMSCSPVSLLYPVFPVLLYRVNGVDTSFTADNFLHGSRLSTEASFPLVSATPGVVCVLGCSSYITCHPLALLSHYCLSNSTGVLGFKSEYGFSKSCLRLSSHLDGQYSSCFCIFLNSSTSCFSLASCLSFSCLSTSSITQSCLMCFHSSSSCSSFANASSTNICFHFSPYITSVLLLLVFF